MVTEEQGECVGSSQKLLSDHKILNHDGLNTVACEMKDWIVMILPVVVNHENDTYLENGLVMGYSDCKTVTASIMRVKLKHQK